MAQGSRLENSITRLVDILEAEENERLAREARQNEQLSQITDLFDEIHTQNQRLAPHGRSIDIPIREGELADMPDPIANFLTVLIHERENKMPLLRLKTSHYPEGERELILRVVFDQTSNEGEILVNIPVNNDLKVTAEAINTSFTSLDKMRRSEDVFEQGMQPDPLSRADGIDIKLAVAQKLLRYVREQGADAVEMMVKDASKR